MTMTTQHAIDLMPQLRDILQLPADLDLPKLFGIRAEMNHDDPGWTVTAHLWPSGNDLTRWEALKAWGRSQEPVLGEAHAGSGQPSGSWRKASVTIAVAQVSVEIWTHVDAEFVPTMPEPVRVTGAFADFLLGEDVTA